MADSVIIGFVISLFKALVRWYDASGLAAVINGVCDFFKNRAGGSLAVWLFRRGVLQGEWWQNSLSYKLLKAPLTGRKNKSSAEPGIITGTLINIFNVPLYSIGAGFICYAVFAFLVSFLTNSVNKVSLIAILIIAVAGLLCILFRVSAYELYLGSRFLRFIGGFFYTGEYSKPQTKRVKTLLLCIVSGITGVLAGFSGPMVTFVAVCGVLFAAAVVARYEIGVYSVLFLAAFLPTSAAAGLCVLTAVGFLAGILSGRIKNLRPSVLAPLIAMYVLFALFATLTSFHMFSSAFIFAVYLIFIAAYVFIVNTLTTPAKWRAAIVCFAAGALLIGIYGIIQNFTMDVTTQSWVDTQMFEDIKTRVYATFDNPNVLGQYFIITIPLIFAIFVRENDFLKKTCWLGIFAVCFLCLLYTWSRGAWVGVMLGIVVFLLLRDRRWIVLCILGLLAIPFVLPESILQRILSIGDLSDSSTAYRVSVWIASARMAMDFWMSGVGFGSEAFKTVYSNYALNGAGFALHAHNFYIQLVLDMGIGGLIVFLLTILAALREISTVKVNSSIRVIMFAFVGILAGYMFQAVAESMWYNMRMALMFWIVMAFISSGAAIKGEEV